MLWREQTTFDEMLMMTALCQKNTPSISIVLAHWNSSPPVGMSHFQVEHMILIPSQPVFALSP